MCSPCRLLQQLFQRVGEKDGGALHTYIICRSTDAARGSKIITLSIGMRLTQGAAASADREDQCRSGTTTWGVYDPDWGMGHVDVPDPPAASLPGTRPRQRCASRSLSERQPARSSPRRGGARPLPTPSRASGCCCAPSPAVPAGHEQVGGRRHAPARGDGREGWGRPWA